MSSPYPRDTVDAMIGSVKHELKADIKDLRAEMLQIEGLLASRIDGMRGEWKVWMLVMGAILTVMSSGVSSRIMMLLWPPAASVPGGR